MTSAPARMRGGKLSVVGGKVRYIGVSAKPPATGGGGGGGGGGGTSTTVRRGSMVYIATGSQFPSAPETTRNAYLDDMADLGIGGIRVKLNLDTQANRDTSNQIVGYAHSKGMKVVGVLVCDADTTVTQAANRGTWAAGGTVGTQKGLTNIPDALEDGNESNFEPQWNPTGVFDEPMLSKYVPIGQAQRDAAAAAGFSGDIVPGGPSPKSVAQDLGSKGIVASTTWIVGVMAQVAFDAASYHSYCYPAGPDPSVQTDPRHGVRLTEECITDLLAAGYGTKSWPYITEVGWTLDKNTAAEKLAYSAAMVRRYTNETITIVDRRVTPNVSTTYTRKVADLRPVCFYCWNPKYKDGAGNPMPFEDQGAAWIDFRKDNDPSNPLIDQSSFRAGMKAVLAETVTFAA